MNQRLLKELEFNNIELIEIPLAGRLKGLYADNVIAINKKIDSKAEKNCILAEELGHYHTSVGDILDQSDLKNRKQERRARTWGYERLVSLLDIINAKKEGVRNRYELAEFLGVTEDFLVSALKYYKEKHGKMCFIGDYIIEFEPLEVYEMVDFDTDSTY